MSQYFDNDNNIRHNKRIIEFYFNDKKYNLYSDNGVFSKDKFDYGTRLLLDSIDISKLSGNVLDLGCGIGVVGIILGTINKNINIDMIDINERAISLVRDNLTLNKVKANVFSSDVYSNVNKKYDYIITNPPIRAGKEVVRKFLLGGYDYLNDNGILYFVMRKDDFYFCISLDDILDVVSFLQESGILKQHPIEKGKNAREEAATALSNGKIEPKENNFPLYSFTGDIIEAEMAEDGDMYFFLLQNKDSFITLSLEDVLICLRVAELSGEIEPLVGFWNLRGIYPRLEEWFISSKAEELLMSRYW